MRRNICIIALSERESNTQVTELQGSAYTQQKTAKG